MVNQFSRLELLLGKDTLDKLATKNVIVFGLGGVGGNVCDALVRSGIKNITIVDNDVVAITNINRQLIANLNTVGKVKVDVMEEHLKSINKEVNVTKKQIFFLPENKEEIDFKKYDYVVDAIDTVSAKIEIVKICKSLQIPVISALGCGNKLDPTKLEVADLSKTSYDPLAKVLRRELRKYAINHLKVIYSKENPIEIKGEIEEETSKKRIPGSSAFVPPVAGIIIASEVIKDLLN